MVNGFVLDVHTTLKLELIPARQLRNFTLFKCHTISRPVIRLVWYLFPLYSVQLHTPNTIQ